MSIDTQPPQGGPSQERVTSSTAGALAPAGGDFDLIVVGAGAAGLATALFGAIRGLEVLVLEKTGHVGGTSAFSAGTTWVPNTAHAATVGAQDSVARVMTYLDRVVGSYGDRAMREAFVANGPAAIALLEAQTHVRFRPYPRHPDYESELEGATLCGRALEPLPFDGRLLGDRFSLVRPPIPEFTVLGGMMVDRTDIGHLLAATRSWASLGHSLRIVGRHALDRLSWPRGTRLVMGNALVGRLLLSLVERSVPVWTEARVEAFESDREGVRGLIVDHGGHSHRLRARAGVVLASGGFNRNPALRAKLIPAAATYTPGAPGHTGEALVLALDLGARLGDNNLDPAFWAPVSVRQRADGTMAVFPHFVLDRAKPGTVVVNGAGERFVNESTSYHRFARAMLGAQGSAPAVPAFLVADHRAVQAYGLGMVRPGGRGLRPFLEDGYLATGQTIGELAGHLGIPPAGLEATVARMNAFAASGVDADFARGATDYQRNIGDPAFRPNPNLGPIARAPFYAIRLYPGDIGASAGLVTDVGTRVLDAEGRPIPGLYAVGNDMNSIMGGTYPGPGITLGPGLTFAFVAANSAAARVGARPAIT